MLTNEECRLGETLVRTFLELDKEIGQNVICHLLRPTRRRERVAELHVRKSFLWCVGIVLLALGLGLNITQGIVWIADIDNLPTDNPNPDPKHNYFVWIGVEIPPGEYGMYVGHSAVACVEKCSDEGCLEKRAWLFLNGPGYGPTQQEVLPCYVEAIHATLSQE